MSFPMRDDLPVVLVTLDGLGDRPCRTLDGRTPLQVAATPVLDALVTRGAGGMHVPFGPGWSTSSERSHWAMFGLQDLPFPGRAALEWAGVGGSPPLGVPHWHLAVRQGGQIRDESSQATWTAITGRLSGRSGGQVDTGAVEISAQAGQVLDRWCASYCADGIDFRITPLRTGEWVLIAHGAVSHEVSDTDPLFDHIHPWMRPVPLREAARAGGERAVQAERTAHALEGFLLGAHVALRNAQIDYDIPTTKWASRIDDPLDFSDEIGVPGAMVTSSALYRGLARLLGMREIDIPAPPGDVALGLTRRVAAAVDLLDNDSSLRFVHVHTKAPDEAGHTKDPWAKVAAIEACDSALARLLARLADTDFVLAVTGDHATPSESLLMHSGDPTPFAVAGPDVLVDRVTRFDEAGMLQGSLGHLRAVDLAPLLHSLARRPFFIGHRPGPALTPAMPMSVPAMPDVANAMPDAANAVTAPPRTSHDEPIPPMNERNSPA